MSINEPMCPLRMHGFFICLASAFSGAEIACHLGVSISSSNGAVEKAEGLSRLCAKCVNVPESVYGVPVSHVHVDKLVEKDVCKKPLNESFMLIDNSTLVLFHLKERIIDYFEVITDTQLVHAYKKKFQLIESLSST